MPHIVNSISIMSSSDVDPCQSLLLASDEFDPLLWGHDDAALLTIPSQNKKFPASFSMFSVRQGSWMTSLNKYSHYHIWLMMSPRIPAGLFTNKSWLGIHFYFILVTDVWHMFVFRQSNWPDYVKPKAYNRK